MDLDYNADLDNADLDNADIAQAGHEAHDQPVEQAADQRSAEDDDLRESLEGLSRLASSRLPLEALLTQVATYAVRAIPGADGAGLTLLEEGRADTIVATAPFVTEIDDIQYGMGQGPCISAAREGIRSYLVQSAQIRAGRGSEAGLPGSAFIVSCRCH